MFDLQHITNDLKEYSGLSEGVTTSLDDAVARVVNQKGSGIFLEPENLVQALVSDGVSQSEAYGLVLLTGVDGFDRLVNAGKFTDQTDLDRIVKNAQYQTGLSRTAAMRYLRAVCLAFGVAADCISLDDVIQASLDEKAFVVPEGSYINNLLLSVSKKVLPALAKAKQAINNMSDDTEGTESARVSAGLSTSDLEKLNGLVTLGVPIAKYYMGTIMLYGLEGQASPTAGLTLLKEAASSGDSWAAAELGDYYFSQGPTSWDIALKYYTGIGAVALTEERQEPLVIINNQRHFNRKLLKASAVLIGLVLLFVILAPGTPIYEPHYVAGVICFVLSLVILLLSMLIYKRKPFGNFGFVPAGITIAWAVFVLIRLLF